MNTLQEKPRAFLFDINDWLGSFSVEKMSGDEVKAYIYLLCRSWHETPIATLPNDEAELAAMARLSPEKWQGVREAVLARFCVNGNGRLHNTRLQKEATYATARAKAGAQGWDNKRRSEQRRRAKKLPKKKAVAKK